MSNLFLTDFIKNKTIQIFALLGLALDVLLSQSVIHMIVLLGFPYAASIILNQLIKTQHNNKFKPRISEQFRPQRSPKIKITPLE